MELCTMCIGLEMKVSFCYYLLRCGDEVRLNKWILLSTPFSACQCWLMEYFMEYINVFHFVWLICWNIFFHIPEINFPSFILPFIHSFSHSSSKKYYHLFTRKQPLNIDVNIYINSSDSELMNKFWGTIVSRGCVLVEVIIVQFLFLSYLWEGHCIYRYCSCQLSVFGFGRQCGRLRCGCVTLLLKLLGLALVAVVGRRLLVPQSTQSLDTDPGRHCAGVIHHIVHLSWIFLKI